MPKHRQPSPKDHGWLVRLLRAVSKVEKKIEGLLKGHDFKVLLRLLKAYSSGTYKQVPWRTITLATCGLLYLINPLDAVADVLPFIGFTDDAAILGAILGAIREDLDRFREWEKRQ